MDIAELSAIVASVFAAAATAISSAAQGAVDDLTESAADSLKNKAVGLWRRLRGDDDEDELNSAIELAGSRPSDERRLALLSEIIAERLERNPDLVVQLLSEYNGSGELQEIRALNGSIIERVVQSISSTGVQKLEVNDSQVRDVRQVRG